MRKGQGFPGGARRNWGEVGSLSLQNGVVTRACAQVKVGAAYPVLCAKARVGNMLGWIDQDLAARERLNSPHRSSKHDTARRGECVCVRVVALSLFSRSPSCSMLRPFPPRRGKEAGRSYTCLRRVCGLEATHFRARCLTFLKLQTVRRSIAGLVVSATAARARLSMSSEMRARHRAAGC